MALVSAKRSRLQAAAEQGRAGAKSALALMEDPTTLLSAIQIGITLLTILTGITAARRSAAPLAEMLTACGVPDRSTRKKLAYRHRRADRHVRHAHRSARWCRSASRCCMPSRWPCAVAPIMRVLARISAPLVWLLRVGSQRDSQDTAALLRAAGGRHRRRRARAGRRRHAAGVFLASERRLLEGVLALADRKVGSIMIPRQDVIWLDIEDPIDVAVAAGEGKRPCALPVAREKLESLLGMITLANLSEAVHRGRARSDATWSRRCTFRIRSRCFSCSTNSRSSSTHLAVVTDEYGEIEGITTPIDILKAIAGELPELGSRERPEATQRADGAWLVDGHLPIEELQRRLNRRDMVGRDYQTVAGSCCHASAASRRRATR